MSAKELEKALNEGDDVDLILGVWERRFAEHDWPRNDGALDQGRKLRKAVNDGITSRDTFALKQAIARAELIEETPGSKPKLVDVNRRARAMYIEDGWSK